MTDSPVGRSGLAVGVGVGVGRRLRQGSLVTCLFLCQSAWAPLSLSVAMARSHRRFICTHFLPSLQAHHSVVPPSALLHSDLIILASPVPRLCLRFQLPAVSEKQQHYRAH
ncbi:hypothetical protein BDW68DRAFT_35496 [Aspergillus falconensis]